jgi:chromosome segregation ATPase
MSFSNKCLYLLLPVACLLVSCNKESNYSYLIEHPAALFQDYNDCQYASTKTQERVAQCQMISSAVSTIKSNIQKMQDDPEAFGQQLLDKEIAWAKINDQLHQAQQAVEILKSQHAASADITAAEQKVSVIEQQGHQQHDDVKMMLSAIGLFSPE